MTMLIQSFVEVKDRLPINFRIRYLAKRRAAQNDQSFPGAMAMNATGEGMSYIVIHPSYGYLEDEIRRLFAHVPDVQVLVERRQGERRRLGVPLDAERRKPKRTRRMEAVPMLEVILRFNGGYGTAP